MVTASNANFQRPPLGRPRAFQVMEPSSQAYGVPPAAYFAVSGPRSAGATAATGEPRPTDSAAGHRASLARSNAPGPVRGPTDRVERSHAAAGATAWPDRTRLSLAPSLAFETQRLAQALPQEETPKLATASAAYRSTSAFAVGFLGLLEPLDCYA